MQHHLDRVIWEKYKRPPEVWLIQILAHSALRTFYHVNFGKLKKNTFDERSKFIDKIITYSKDKINFNILGLYNEEPKWNYDFNNEIMFSKTALNLSRGGPNKYASSNRIASLMGNGILIFIDEKTKFQDFFKNGEIITYKNEIDLINKLLSIKDDKKELLKRAKLAKKNYFKYF